MSLEEWGWILRVCGVICVGMVAFAGWYAYYSRMGFGGEVLFEVDLSYRGESSPEQVFRGLLVRRTDTHTGYERFILNRTHLGLNDIALAKVKRGIIDGYLGGDVEILGKLVDVEYRRELIPGRIREADER